MALDYYRPHASGLSITVERLAHGLADRGHAVTILTHRYTRNLPEEEREGPAFVRVIRADVLGRVGKAQISPGLIWRARREMAATDVVHLHAPLAPAVPLAYLAKARGLPLVVNYHCDLKLPAGPVNRALETIARASQNYAVDRADVLINSTEDYARATPPLARHLDRFVPIVPPVPDPNDPVATREQLRARWKIPSGPVILFVGRFAEEKGIHHLIAALPIVRAALPDAVLLLAGERTEIPGETVGERLAPLLADPTSGVVATGFVPDEEMSSLFALADVLVLPSTNSTESFGQIQVEAMLSGLPVVASDLPGVREPIRRTGMGKIAPIGDPRGLAGQIVEVLRSPDRYKQSRSRVRKLFLLDQTISLYEAAYGRARTPVK